VGRACLRTFRWHRLRRHIRTGGHGGDTAMCRQSSPARNGSIQLRFQEADATRCWISTICFPQLASLLSSSSSFQTSRAAPSILSGDIKYLDEPIRLGWTDGTICPGCQAPSGLQVSRLRRPRTADRNQIEYLRHLRGASSGLPAPASRLFCTQAEQIPEFRRSDRPQKACK
jgi:hypothetical protein